MWSSEKSSGMTPKRLTRPEVGLSPTKPQNEAGMRMEPPVSLPMAAGTIPLATAAAEPPLEPPGIREGSCGLRMVPKCGLFEVMP